MATITRSARVSVVAPSTTACTTSSSPRRSTCVTCATRGSMPAATRCRSSSATNASLTSPVSDSSPAGFIAAGYVKMGLRAGRFTSVANGWVDSKIANSRPARFASSAAAIPATPPPMIARSSTPSAAPRRAAKPGSASTARTAFAPVSAANLSSGTPARSPATRSPGTCVVPSSRTSGSLSTAPEGHLPCSQSK